MGSFEGRVAVVTGGASGIGRGIGVALARRGASVALADLHEARLDETVRALEALGTKALGLRCDVTSDAEVERFRTWRIDIERSLTDAIERQPAPPRLD